MNDILNGVELVNINREKVGVVFFDSNNLYFASGNQPVVIQNIQETTIRQLGDFFYYLGDMRLGAAVRIDFNNNRDEATSEEVSIRVIETTIYFSQERTTIMFERIGFSEMKRFGTWLKKRSK